MNSSVHDVAAYVLAQLGQMGTMKLQKLIYYCQAWSVVWDERPLFDETIEAWEHGPVVRELYAQHRRQPFVASLPKGDATTLDADQRATIDAVLRVYGHRTDWWLRRLTHAERPWVDADHNQIISVDELATYYSRLRTSHREIPVEVVRGFDAIATLPDEALAGVVADDATEIEGLEEWLATGAGDPWAASRD